MDSHQFVVRITDYEPLSLGGTKRQKYDRKKKLLERIEQNFESQDLLRCRGQFQDKLVKVSVVFFLWKGSPHFTDTVFKKDLDNLVKPVLDVLQNDVDQEKSERGLGLIQNDLQVCVLHLAKELVAKPKDRGLQIIVSEHRDEEMLRVLQNHDE